MNIAGIGIVFSRGRGVPSLEKALQEGWVPPSDSMYSVTEDTLRDKSVLREMRRADCLSKMATLAAYDALMDSAVGAQIRSSLGIILATAFGPHVTTFRFLDDILDYGDANVSPTIFSHSVHNAAVAYISYALQSRGPALTITQFMHSFQQAVMLAESWLREDRCEYILLGSVDQCGKVMKYICSQKLHLAEDGKIRPFLFDETPAAIPGEGSVFFLVSKNKTHKNYCSISTLPDDNVHEPDMYIFDCDGMAGNEGRYRELTHTRSFIGCFTPIFGSMLTVSSFHCAVAALMLKNQLYYAAPVQDNPHGVHLCKIHQPAMIGNIRCVRYGCKGERIEISLTR